MRKPANIGALAFSFCRDIDAEAIVAIAVEGINEEIQQAECAGQATGETQEEEHITAGGLVHSKIVVEELTGVGETHEGSR